MNVHSGKTILLVEDEHVTAIAQKNILEKFGYTVLSAHSGDEAIRIFNSNEVDLILMDINLDNGIDGTEAAEIILKDNDIPIVFLSSHTSPEIVEKSEKITSYGYVAKNSNNSILNASIKMAFKLFEQKQIIKGNQLKLAASNEELTASQEMLNSMFSFSDYMVCIADLKKGYFTKVSPAFIEHLGWSEEEMLSKPILDFIHPDDAEKTAKIIKELTEKEIEILKFENRYKTKSGQYRWLEWSARPAHSKGITYASAYDITERNFAREELEEKTMFIEKLLNVTALSTWISDEHGTAIMANPACYKFFGAVEEEVIGKYNVFRDAVAEEQGVMPVIRSAYETGEPVSFLLDYNFGSVDHVNVKNATHKFVKVNLTPIVDSNGKVKNVVSQSIDLTDIKKIEKELKKSLQENKDLLREIQHRAKNSFGLIASMIELMKESSTSDEVKSVLNEAVSRILAVSEMYDLLYLSDSITEVKLDEYLLRVISSLPIINSNIEIKNSFDPITMLVKRGITIGLIAAELITNSIKYAFPNSKKGTINITLKRIDKLAILEVKDDGVGFSEEPDLSKIDSLGLTIINTLVKQIDGSFIIENYGGTQCVVKFPL